MYRTAHNNWQSLICLCANRSTDCYLPIIWHHSAVFVGGVCSHHGPMKCKREHLTCHTKVPVSVKAVKHTMETPHGKYSDFMNMWWGCQCLLQ